MKYVQDYLKWGSVFEAITQYEPPAGIEIPNYKVSSQQSKQSLESLWPFSLALEILFAIEKQAELLNQLT